MESKEYSTSALHVNPIISYLNEVVDVDDFTPGEAGRWQSGHLSERGSVISLLLINTETKHALGDCEGLGLRKTPLEALVMAGVRHNL